jgi:hypothetical protein
MSPGLSPVQLLEQEPLSGAHATALTVRTLGLLVLIAPPHPHAVH